MRSSQRRREGRLQGRPVRDGARLQMAHLGSCSCVARSSARALRSALQAAASSLSVCESSLVKPFRILSCTSASSALPSSAATARYSSSSSWDSSLARAKGAEAERRAP